VFDRCLASLFDGLSRRKQLVLGLGMSVTVVAGIRLESISLDDNIDRMLPEDVEIRRGMRLLRESHLAEKVLVSLWQTAEQMR